MSSIDDLQVTIRNWGVSKFGAAHMEDHKTRGLRLVEETIEYCQALGLSQEDVTKVIQHVFSRPANKHPLDELGGVLLTAVAAADTFGAWAHGLLAAEVTRVLSKNDGSLEASEQRKQKAGLVP